MYLRIFMFQGNCKHSDKTVMTEAGSWKEGEVDEGKMGLSKRMERESDGWREEG